MAQGDLKQSVQVQSKDELGELAAAFNQMSADLDRLLQARRQMTSDIAHDLRNPLTVIGGYIESIRDGVLKPTPERLDAIQAEVRHLERLVEDLRTLAQADAGELGLNREPVWVAGLLEGAAQSYRPLAERQAITLSIHAEAGLPPIHADPDRLAQVLGNLIRNALRYTHEGGEIVLEAGAQGGKWVRLTVADNGKGIAAEALPYIFDRLYRADPARSHSEELGLGLAIAVDRRGARGQHLSREHTRRGDARSRSSCRCRQEACIGRRPRNNWRSIRMHYGETMGCGLLAGGETTGRRCRSDENLDNVCAGGGGGDADCAPERRKLEAGEMLENAAVPSVRGGLR